MSKTDFKEENVWNHSNHEDVKFKWSSNYYKETKARKIESDQLDC